MSVQLPFLYPLEAGRLHATLSAKNTRIDKTEAVATRPLAIQKDGAWYTYGHDLTKNVWELYKTNGTIASTYDYAPFGGVTANGTAEQPFQWSSEFYDSELGMVYYNFRFYNPLDGRWISRDPIGESRNKNLYRISDNNTINQYDQLGLNYFPYAPGVMNPPSTYDSPVYWPSPLSEINNSSDALQHFRSRAGGSVPAGKKLIDQIKNSAGFINNRKEAAAGIKKNLLEKIGDHLCSENSGTWQNPGTKNTKGVGVYTGNNAVGHASFQVAPYDVQWQSRCIRVSLGASYLKVVTFHGHRSLSFRDKYHFDEMEYWYQFFTDTIPSYIAGSGTPFFIVGSFEDDISGAFLISCNDK